MELDPFLLARLQFALNISFHILFPTITIALGWILFYFRVRYTRSAQKEWEYAYYFWVKIFALTFALGVVSGITMSFQFGTNWPGFMQRVGNIGGPLLGYEVLTAFFLEASFLGVMLFGKDRVYWNKMLYQGSVMTNRLLHLRSQQLKSTSSNNYWQKCRRIFPTPPYGLQLPVAWLIDCWNRVTPRVRVLPYCASMILVHYELKHQYVNRSLSIYMPASSYRFISRLCKNHRLVQ